MTVAVPIQVFLVASWTLSFISGAIIGFYSGDNNESSISIGVIILIVSLIFLGIGMP